MKKLRPLIGATLGLITFFFQHVSAQEKPKQDSIYQQFTLKEVIVTEKAKGNDATLKFYKSSKTNSTEDILSHIAGVNLIRRGSYGMEPVIRGFSANQISLTLDGIKIFGACTDHMDPPTSYIEPSNLKSIQLATSAAASKFGSNIGGSLNFKLAQADLNPLKSFSGSISSSYSLASQSTNNILQFNYGKKKWAIRFSGVYRKAGDYLANNEVIPYTQYQKLNFSVNSKYLLNKNTYLTLDLLADDGWDMGYAALPMDVAYAKARIYALSYKSFLKNSIFKYFEAKVYGNNIAHSMDDTHRQQISMHMDMPGWSNTYGGYAETAVNWSVDHLLTIRADGFRNFTRAEMTMYPKNSTPMFMLTWPDVRNEMVGIYFNNDWKLAKNIALSLNTRFDYSNSMVKSEMGREQLAVFDYNVDKPRQKILKNFNGSLLYTFGKFYGNLSIGFSERPTSTNELYGYYLFNAFDGYDYIGNPYLKNENALNGEISLGYKTEDTEVSATLFANRINNYTLGVFHPKYSTMTIGANGTKIYEQLPYANLKGFELSLNTLLLKNLRYIGNVRFTEGKDDNGISLPLIAPLKLISSLRYSKTSFNIQLENEWAAAQNRVNRSVNEKPTAAYALFNVRSSYHFKLKQHNLELNVGIENVLDTYYHEHLDWGNIPRPGRTIFAGLSYSF